MNYCVILKALREKLCISQTDLAKRIGVSYASVNRWENGRATPYYASQRKIKSLCAHYKIKTEDRK